MKVVANFDRLPFLLAPKLLRINERWDTERKIFGHSSQRRAFKPQWLKHSNYEECFQASETRLLTRKYSAAPEREHKVSEEGPCECAIPRQLSASPASDGMGEAKRSNSCMRYRSHVNLWQTQTGRFWQQIMHGTLTGILEVIVSVWYSSYSHHRHRHRLLWFSCRCLIIWTWQSCCADGQWDDLGVKHVVKVLRVKVNDPQYLSSGSLWVGFKQGRESHCSWLLYYWPGRMRFLKLHRLRREDAYSRDWRHPG